RIVRSWVVQHIERIGAKLNRLGFADAERLTDVCVEDPSWKCVHRQRAKVALMSRQRILQQRNAIPALRYGYRPRRAAGNDLRQSLEAETRLPAFKGACERYRTVG